MFESKVAQWNETITVEPIDNATFGTVEAQQEHYNGDPTGQYILLLADRIIIINMEDVAMPAQIAVIREKLEM